MKTLGTVAHGAEGAALCFLTACREGTVQLGPHMHPNIVMSAVPLALLGGVRAQALANTVKHFAFTRCGELNLFGMVDAQIAVVEGELL